MAEDDADHELANEFLTHVLMNETADYVRRGRQHESLQSSDLEDQWVAAVRDVFVHQKAERVRDMDDLAAELRLRGLRG